MTTNDINREAAIKVRDAARYITVIAEAVQAVNWPETVAAARHVEANNEQMGIQDIGRFRASIEAVAALKETIDGIYPEHSLDPSPSDPEVKRMARRIWDDLTHGERQAILILDGEATLGIYTAEEPPEILARLQRREVVFGEPPSVALTTLGLVVAAVGREQLAEDEAKAAAEEIRAAEEEIKGFEMEIDIPLEDVPEPLLKAMGLSKRFVEEGHDPDLCHRAVENELRDLDRQVREIVSGPNGIRERFPCLLVSAGVSWDIVDEHGAETERPTP